jgi:hypothetical protein
MAIAATAHGSTFAVECVAAGEAGWVPTAVPHRWQNFAPGESNERQPAHTASPTAAPHSEQNRPVVGAAQLGHALAVEVEEAMPQS